MIDFDNNKKNGEKNIYQVVIYDFFVIKRSRLLVSYII